LLPYPSTRTPVQHSPSSMRVDVHLCRAAITMPPVPSSPSMVSRSPGALSDRVGLSWHTASAESPHDMLLQIVRDTSRHPRVKTITDVVMTPSGAQGHKSTQSSDLRVLIDVYRRSLTQPFAPGANSAEGFRGAEERSRMMSRKSLIYNSARGGTRTRTGFPPRDFKARVTIRIGRHPATFLGFPFPTWPSFPYVLSPTVTQGGTHAPPAHEEASILRRMDDGVHSANRWRRWSDLWHTC
jgi:hypothetical protein